ncbi:hypothetical protein FRB94_008617 [Tulasnella sp. JGI-2019a]|nr:hypothetical protein FRB93_001479 [Tulasnella sp. JGI-2019a]KAG8995977.1 hypothetical protein FRB94_008617 [Tulasnella sp. JGI-2019a]KAG9033298.1 hypothetical protein FRB95_000393 [Tulasnella sp. JGI-2019a]
MFRFILLTFLLLALGILASPIPVPDATSILERAAAPPDNEARALEPRGKQTMTWFYPGMGACGKRNGSNDKIIAIPQALWANGKHCGKQVKISGNGKSVVATVQDMCPSDGGCPDSGHIDVSPATFKAISANYQQVGEMTIAWSFM